MGLEGSSFDKTDLQQGDLASAQEAQSQGKASRLLHSAAYAAVESPVLGLTQIGDHVLGKSATGGVSHWFEDKLGLQAPSATKFGSGDWAASTIGSAVGMLVPFAGTKWALGKAHVLGAADAAATGALTTKTALGLSVRDAAATGFAYDALLTPSGDHGNFWQNRGLAGVGGALTFGTLAAGSFGLQKLGTKALGAQGAEAGTRPFLGGVPGRMANGAISGVPAGLVSTEYGSIVNDHKLLAPKSAYAESAASMALAGGLLSGLHSIRRAPEAESKFKPSDDSKGLDLRKEPESTQPSAKPEPIESTQPSAKPEPIESTQPSAKPEPTESTQPSAKPEPIEFTQPPARPEPLESIQPSEQRTLAEKIERVRQQDKSGDWKELTHQDGTVVTYHSGNRKVIYPDKVVAEFSSDGAIKFSDEKGRSVEPRIVSKISNADGGETSNDAYGNRITKNEKTGEISLADNYGYRAKKMSDGSFESSDISGILLKRNAAGEINIEDSEHYRVGLYRDGSRIVDMPNGMRRVYVDGDKLKLLPDGGAVYKFKSGSALVKQSDQELKFFDEDGRTFACNEPQARLFDEYVKKYAVEKPESVDKLLQSGTAEEFKSDELLDGRTRWEKRAQEMEIRRNELATLPLTIGKSVEGGASGNDVRWGELTRPGETPLRVVVHVKDNDVTYKESQRSEDPHSRMNKEFAAQTFSPYLFGTWSATAKRTIEIDGKASEAWIQDASGRDLVDVVDREAVNDRTTMPHILREDPDLIGPLTDLLLDNLAVGNSDVHAFNIGMKELGKPAESKPDEFEEKSFDADLAFRNTNELVWPTLPAEDPMSNVLGELSGQPLPASRVNRLKEFVAYLNTSEGRAELKNKSKLSDFELDGVVLRLKTLVRDGRFPRIVPKIGPHIILDPSVQEFGKKKQDA